MGRRKNGYGGLVNRKGYWAMRWTVDGKIKQELTKFKVSVKADRAKAEALLEERTALFRMRNESDQLAVLISRRQNIQERLKDTIADSTPTAKPLLLGELEAAWKESPRRRDCSAAQLKRYSQELNAFIDWAGREVDFRAVDDEMAEKYAAHLTKTKSANTYNKHLNTLTGVWKAVGRARRVPNPWVDLPRRRLDTHVRRALTAQEIDSVIAAAEGEYKALLIIGAQTGLRMGDASHLQWENFDAKGILRAKTSKTCVTVVLPAAKLLAELKALLAPKKKKLNGLIVPAVAATYDRDPATVSLHIRRIFEKAGLKTQAKEKGWSKARAEASFHSLRHSFVTKAIEAGVPPPIVRAMVGHTTAAMTDRYSHIGEEAILAAFDKARI